MILIDGITIQVRRDAIRQLADISDKSYSDTQLDAKILNGDDLAQTWLQEDTASRTLITLSNIITAKLIRMGIGGTENTEAVRQLNDMAAKIVTTYNEKGDSQNKSIFGFTSEPQWGGDRIATV